jgi:hypothetical protein
VKGDEQDNARGSHWFRPRDGGPGHASPAPRHPAAMIRRFGNLEQPGAFFLHRPKEECMLNLFVFAGLVAGICVLIMSGAIAGVAPLTVEFAEIVFAVSAGLSTLAIAALDG